MRDTFARRTPKDPSPGACNQSPTEPDVHTRDGVGMAGDAQPTAWPYRHAPAITAAQRRSAPKSTLVHPALIEDALAVRSRAYNCCRCDFRPARFRCGHDGSRGRPTRSRPSGLCIVVSVSCHRHVVEDALLACAALFQPRNTATKLPTGKFIKLQIQPVSHRQIFGTRPRPTQIAPAQWIGLPSNACRESVLTPMDEAQSSHL